MNKIKEVLLAVYCDGLVKGTNSTAKTNFKNINEALSSLRSLIRAKRRRNK